MYARFGFQVRSLRAFFRGLTMKSVLRMSLLAAATVAALGFTTISVQASGRPDLALHGLVNGKAHVADQLIVEFKAGASDQDKSRALSLVGGKKEKALNILLKVLTNLKYNKNVNLSTKEIIYISFANIKSCKYNK